MFSRESIYIFYLIQTSVRIKIGPTQFYSIDLTMAGDICNVSGSFLPGWCPGPRVHMAGTRKEHIYAGNTVTASCWCAPDNQGRDIYGMNPRQFFLLNPVTDLGAVSGA